MADPKPTNLADLQSKGATKRRSMQELEKLPPKQRVSAFLEDNRAQIAAALPRHISADRMLQVAQTAVTQTPALLECYAPTLFGSLIKCTQLGLEPNNALGQLYLVPFNNRKERRKDCQVVIGYRGMIDLARRSGAIKSIWADAVREGDLFEYERGMDDRLRHVEGESQGEITYFYAYAHLKDGGFVFDVKSVGWMRTHMLTTQSKGTYGPWKDHFEQMGRKTMVRRLFNYLPVSIEMAEAQAVDATGDSVAQNMDRVLQGEYSVLDEVGGVIESSDAEAEVVAALAPTSDIVDSAGEIFDPEQHLCTESGMPMYNQDDSFRKRPQRGKSKQEEDDEAAAATEYSPSDNEPPWNDDELPKMEVQGDDEISVE